MLKVGMIGILVTFLSMICKKEKGEYAVLMGIAAVVLIFSFVLVQVQQVADFLQTLIGRLPLDDGMLTILFKMLGITYIGEFASSICKDAGYASLAGQIELFAKISILVLSIPCIGNILELLDAFFVS